VGRHQLEERDGYDRQANEIRRGRPGRPPSRPPDDLGFASATRLVQLLRDSELSSRDLLEHYLARIGTHDHAVHAVVTVDAERARRDADAADAAIAAGSPVGPLHGCRRPSRPWGSAPPACR
jgi:hypothetical protein